MNGKKYYVSGNTAEGFIRLLPSNVSSFAHTVILCHPSERLKTMVLQNLIAQLEQKHEIEVLLSALGSNYLDGFIVREKAVAVVTDRVAEKDLSGTIELNINYFLDSKSEISNDFKEKHQKSTEAAYHSFKKGLKIHDELEKIYINEMDFNRADELAENLIHELLAQKAAKPENNPHEYKRMFGTNTPQGAVNIVPELIDSISTVYYLKGRAGTGKSTFMKKIAAACKVHGFDLEKYYCSFDPGSIDMIYVPALDVAIFDSTDPHEFFPSRKGEIIIDLYEEAVAPGTDEKYADEIEKTTKRYKAHMKKGIQHLQEADRYLDSFEGQFQYTEKEINNIVTFIEEIFFA